MPYSNTATKNEINKQNLSRCWWSARDRFWTSSKRPGGRRKILFKSFEIFSDFPIWWTLYSEKCYFVHWVLSYYGSKHGSNGFAENCSNFHRTFHPLKRKKKSWNLTIPGLFMVAEAGLEPTTSGLWARRASNCSTPRYLCRTLKCPVIVPRRDIFVNPFFL